MGLLIFKSSLNFNSADKNFQNLVSPYLSVYSEKLFIELFNIIESEYQVQQRAKMVSDSAKIKAFSDKILGVNFDYKKFPHFFSKYTEFIKRGDFDASFLDF